MITLLHSILTGTAHLEEIIYGYHIINSFRKLSVYRSIGRALFVFLLPYFGITFYSVYANNAMLMSQASPLCGMKVLAMPQRKYGTA